MINKMQNFLLLLTYLQVITAKVTIYQTVGDAFIPINSDIPSNKIVGILTLPISKIIQSKIKESFELSSVLEKEHDFLNELQHMTFFPTSYPQWLENENIRVVPLDYHLPDQELFELMDKVNGMLLTGGAVNLYNPDKHIQIDSDSMSGIFKVKEESKYTAKVRALIEHAKNINRTGRTFPIWATCLGYEAMLLSESDLSIPLSKVYNLNYSGKIEPFSGANNFDLFKSIPQKVIANLEEKPLMYFNHENGIHPEELTKNNIMNSRFKILALTYPKGNHSNKPVIAMVQHREHPFYGVQFHPEKNKYEFGEKQAVNHSQEAETASELFSKFFVNKMLQSEFKADPDVYKGMDSFKAYKTENIGVFDEIMIFHRVRRV